MPLDPKCLRKGGQDVYFSSTGHLLPCCAIGRPRENEHEEIDQFYQESLKVSNVDKIEDIISTYEWQQWFDTLINKPEQATKICKRNCHYE